ncbi:helicase associated domain-containing protein [Streptomyces sp. NPDC058175]|uniref:helicase associated domain-containing protein n=1 Tax=Streptomyces sp. NPDC058175 TaxID=3346367 RepID=UPI0036F0C5B9
MEAAVTYAREHGDLRVPFTYRVPAGQDAAAQEWPASLANFPLGQRTADTRRFYARGNMGQVGSPCSQHSLPDSPHRSPGPQGMALRQVRSHHRRQCGIQHVPALGLSW